MHPLRHSYILEFLNRYKFHVAFAMLALISIANLFIDVMDIDAAQYASIAMEMSHNGSYLEIYHRGNDYLDKPPLLFWLSSLSISLFGNSGFAYKLPAVLLLWLSLWATYEFTRLWYDHRTGMYASIILGTTQAFHLMTNDVRTDGLLLSMVICAVYFISSYLKKNSLLDLMVGGFFIGGAMLAKGPLGMIIPVCAIAGHLIITKNLKRLVHWHWVLMLLPVMVVLMPMLYGLYMQFDLHPEKEVYGLKGPSGIWFYFWTQSFGRITGESEWNNGASVFYFMKTILWDLQPWIWFFIVALIFKFRSLFARIQQQEWISTAGFVIPFVALSFSNYKLPHYIFPLFPFASIIVADFVTKKINGHRLIATIHFLMVHVLLIIAMVIIFWVFPENIMLITVIASIIYFAFWLNRIYLHDAVDKIMIPTVYMAILFQLVLSLHFYPRLLNYQSSSQAGKRIAEEKPVQVLWYKKRGHALDFYSGTIINELKEEDIDSIKPGTWIYTNEEGRNALKNVEIVQTFDDYPVTLLRLPFLDPKTRGSVVKKNYLLIHP